MKHAFDDAFRRLADELGFGRNATHNVEVSFIFDSDDCEIVFEPADRLLVELAPVVDTRCDAQADE